MCTDIWTRPQNVIIYKKQNKITYNYKPKLQSLGGYYRYTQVNFFFLFYNARDNVTDAAYNDIIIMTQQWQTGIQKKKETKDNHFEGCSRNRELVGGERDDNINAMTFSIMTTMREEWWQWEQRLWVKCSNNGMNSSGNTS